MTLLGATNAGLSLTACLIVVYLLARFGHVFNVVERPGWAMLATSCFLSIFKQLDMEHVVAPFTPWYQSLWRVGLILAAGGLAYRLHKHHLGNLKQSRILLAHFAAERDAKRH